LWWFGKGLAMSDLPIGTVTFLFTDIEGSTHLLQQLGYQYVTILTESRRLMRTAFQQFHGHEVDTQGTRFSWPFPVPVMLFQPPSWLSAFSSLTTGPRMSWYVSAWGYTPANRCCSPKATSAWMYTAQPES